MIRHVTFPEIYGVLVLFLGKNVLENHSRKSHKNIENMVNCANMEEI